MKTHKQNNEKKQIAKTDVCVYENKIFEKED